MKVVTFNLRCDTPHDEENRWEFRKGLVLDKLDAEKPDLAGQKQVLRALQNGELSAVYLADDADERLRTAVLESAKRAETPVFRVETMKMLGAIAGIGVGAAAAGVKKRGTPQIQDNPPYKGCREL